jgi:hypothetical protein
MGSEWNPNDPNRQQGENGQQGDNNNYQNNNYQNNNYQNQYYQNQYYQSNPNGGFGPQIEPDVHGPKAKTFGLIGLIISLFCCPLAGIVLGILAVLRAKDSKNEMGFLSSDASTGRVLGIVAIVIGALSMLLSLFFTIFIALMEIAAAGAGSGTL